VPSDLGGRLLGQQRDLVELLVERGEIGRDPVADGAQRPCGGRGLRGSRESREERIAGDDQSSGMRIQPCFIA
jgi:hypothetical protein